MVFALLLPIFCIGALACLVVGETQLSRVSEGICDQSAGFSCTFDDYLDRSSASRVLLQGKRHTLTLEGIQEMIAESWVRQGRRGRNFTLTNWTHYEPGSDGTYSQNYQDVWAEALAKHNGWEKGFFLDLGAYHGTECSNSALLEKKLGWNGICVEPMPVGFENRSCVVVARPVSDFPDAPLMFYGSGQNRHIGFRSWEDNPSVNGTSIKTVTVTEIFACLKGGSNLTDCNGIHGQITVPSFINFASLDVEGQEAKVLSAFPWDQYKVGAWVVEQVAEKHRPPDAQEATRAVLRSHGYLQAPVENPGVDEYWVLPEFWSAELTKKALRIHPPGSNGC